MNIEDIAAQLEREQGALIDGIRQNNSDLQHDKERCYFSHTQYGKYYRQHTFPRLRDWFVRAVNDLIDPSTAGEHKKEKMIALKGFLGAIKELKSKNRTDVYNQDNTIGELCDLLSHITITAMLDNAAMPYSGALKKDGTLKTPNPDRKATLDEFEVELGKEIFFQLRLNLLSQALKSWVEGVSKFSSHKGLANLHYHHYNVNRLVDRLVAETKVAFSAVESNPDEFSAEEKSKIRKSKRACDALLAFDLSWSYFKDEKFFGQWCVSIALNGAKLDAFKLEQGLISTYATTVGNKVKRRNGKSTIKSKFCQFLTLSDEYKEKWRVVSTEDENTIDDLTDERKLALSIRIPMIIPPQPLTATERGGWLGDHSPLLESFKGSTELSEKHLQFFNNQAQTAFKINPWVLRLLQVINGTRDLQGCVVSEQPFKLGSFKNHAITPPMRTSDRITSQYTKCPGWDELDDEQQKQLIIDQIGEKAWKKAVAETNAEWEHQHDLKRKGAASRQGLALAEKLVKDEKIYFPLRPDFRNRVVLRTAHVHYQATDHGKALIKFHEQLEVTPETEGDTKRWLLINMANHYGGKLDKESFQTRVSTMEKKVAEIKAVATMLDKGGSWSLGLEVLKQVDFQGGKCFQFAATAREYWELFIGKTKRTTDLIVTVDCSTSGQQIASVWLHNSELAMKTNVKNNSMGKPSDLYGAVFIRMLWLMGQADKKFVKSTQDKLMDLGFGRAICKAAIQGAQYGSGEKTQVEAIREKIAELEAKGQVHFIRKEKGDADTLEDEVELFCKFFPTALEDICQLSTLNKWFKDLAEVVEKVGRDEILIPTPINSTVHIQYKPLKKRRIRTFNYGETKAERMTQIAEPNTDPSEADRKAQLTTWKSSACPNATHAYDACLIAMALHDFPHPFTSCHDSLGCHASGRMDDLRKALQKALLEIANYDVFGEILRMNGVEKRMGKPPIHQNWSTMEYDILNSEYFTG